MLCVRFMCVMSVVNAAACAAFLMRMLNPMFDRPTTHVTHNNTFHIVWVYTCTRTCGVCLFVSCMRIYQWVGSQHVHSHSSPQIYPTSPPHPHDSSRTCVSPYCHRSCTCIWGRRLASLTRLGVTMSTTDAHRARSS